MAAKVKYLGETCILCSCLRDETVIKDQHQTSTMKDKQKSRGRLDSRSFPY